MAERLITRFGSIDLSEGGNTQRYAATVGLRSAGTGPASWEAQAYAIRSGLQLYSDFTFFLKDSVNGDGIEQDDQRSVVGLAATRTKVSTVFGLPGLLAAGAGTRADFINLGLFHQRGRVRLQTRVSDHITQQIGNFKTHDKRLGADAGAENRGNHKVPDKTENAAHTGQRADDPCRFSQSTMRRPRP